MKVVFRVDASFKVGAGHLMRCLTLAEILRERGVTVHFICRNYAGNLIALLEQKEMHVSVLTVDDSATQAEDAMQTIAALKGQKPDWLVVDHYGLNMDWELQLRPHTVKLMVIDDLASRQHDCDVLLDQNYSLAGERRYCSLVTPHCRVLLGPEYALLRKEFEELRSHLEPRSHQLRSILVFFTSGDDQGETLKAMQGIAAFGKVACVNVVTGLANPDNAQIRQKCDELNWGYHCQITYMPTLIAGSDLVIGAGGSSNWERCALGVPALVTILAENQAKIAQDLGLAGIIHNLGWNRDLKAADYANALNALDCDRLAAMSQRALALVDASGVERVVNVLLSA